MSELADAHLNYIGSYRKLADHSAAGEILDSDSIFAFVSGLADPLFNGCVIVGATAEVALDDALEWVGRRTPSYQVAIVEEEGEPLKPFLHSIGLRHHMTLSGMILSPVPAAPPPGVGITIVDGLTGAMAQAMPASMLADPEVRAFTAQLDGRPVGTSIAIRTGSVSGVYAVGTVPDARGRGVGTAASWAAVEAGRAWGCDPIVLQATEMGLPVYRRIGFREIVRYEIFR